MRGQKSPLPTYVQLFLFHLEKARKVKKHYSSLIFKDLAMLFVLLQFLLDSKKGLVILAFSGIKQYFLHLFDFYNSV